MSRPLVAKGQSLCLPIVPAAIKTLFHSKEHCLLLGNTLSLVPRILEPERLTWRGRLAPNCQYHRGPAARADVACSGRRPRRRDPTIPIPTLPDKGEHQWKKPAYDHERWPVDTQVCYSEAANGTSPPTKKQKRLKRKTKNCANQIGTRPSPNKRPSFPSPLSPVPSPCA